LSTLKIIAKNVNIHPKKFKVRTKVNFTLSFSLNVDLPEYSQLIFQFRGGRNNKNDWYFLQSEDPKNHGFITLNLVQNYQMIPIITTGKQLTARYLILETNGIPKNQKIEFTVKNTLVQSIVEKEKKVEILLQIGRNKPIPVQNSPSLNIISGDMQNITIIVPSVICENEDAPILLRIEDKFHNLVKNFEGKIELWKKNLNGNREKFKDINITKSDNGIKHVNKVFFKQKGIYQVEAKFRDKIYGSNLIECKKKVDKRLYWGFIHGHTQKSDGMLSLNDYFQNLIDAGLDFGTNTEHDRIWETSNEDFKEIKEKIEKLNQEGKLVSLFGYEWGKWYTRYGDICIYHKDDSIPIFRSEINKFNSIKKVIKILEKYMGKVLMVGHHSALRPGFRDWNYFHKDLEKLVEIYSCWGNQEYSYFSGNPLPPRYKFFGYGEYARKRGAILESSSSFVQNALEKGYKLGFTAGGDDHYGIYPSGPIDTDNGIYPPGIMAIWTSSKLTKEHLWRALYNRRCYGTTGPRVIIEFYLNGFEMGDIININENKDLFQKRILNFKLISPLKIREIHIIRNNKIFKKLLPKETTIDHSLIDNQNFSEICFRSDITSENFIFYYLRIFLQGKNMAWSSPIWISDMG